MKVFEVYQIQMKSLVPKNLVFEIVAELTLLLVASLAKVPNLPLRILL